MQVEIIISGLATFLNIRDLDKKLTEPSVILVQTDDGGGHLHHEAEAHPNGDHAMSGMEHPTMTGTTPTPTQPGPPPPPPEDHRHIPFIAFDTTKVKVDNLTGFLPVPKAIAHMYMPLGGVELTIENDPAGNTRVDSSYERVAQTDDYWPAAKGHFNPDYVPPRGYRPKKRAVKAFLRFGSGEIAAGNLAKAAWVFFDGNEITRCGVFAEEVVYRDFPHSGDDIVITMTDLETRQFVHKVRFSPLSPNQETLTLAIGNHVAGDLDSAMRRQQATSFKSTMAGSHFAFLNQIASKPGPGPLPKPISVPQQPGSIVGGGTSQGGPCGPTGGGGTGG
jgi:hypothetical protein